MLSEEYFPAERRDQFIFRGKKVLNPLVVSATTNTFCLRLSLNAKSATITKMPSDGSLITSSSTPINIIMILLKLVDNICKEHLWYLSFFLYYRWLKPLYQGIKLGAGDGRTPNAPRTFRKLQVVGRCHRCHQRTCRRHSSWPEFEGVVRICWCLYPQGISPLRYYIHVLIRCLKQVLLDPGFVLEPACNDEGNRLRETGKHFYDDKYRDHFDNLFNSVSDWFMAMGEDPVRHHIPNSNLYV